MSTYFVANKFISLSEVGSDRVLEIYCSIFRLKAKWSITGELESTINWYKAAFIEDKPDPADFTVKSPVKVIWGNQDIFLDVRLGRASLKYVDNDHKKFVEVNGTHWISREMPEVVNKELYEWFNEKF